MTDEAVKTETIKIGNSWYVLEDISGIVGARNDGKDLPVMFLRTGHLVSIDMTPEVIEYLRLKRAGEPVEELALVDTPVAAAGPENFEPVPAVEDYPPGTPAFLTVGPEFGEAPKKRRRKKG